MQFMPNIGKRGQSSLEMLVILGVLILIAIIFAIIYVSSLKSDTSNDTAMSTTVDSFEEDLYDWWIPEQVRLCGDSHCDPGEEQSCPNDCGG